MVEVPDFGTFYRAVHGREAFPWQTRLAAVVEEAGWPTEIGIPTGLGKTACVDVAVWSLARQAERAPAERVAPTRIWYVVNRRLLVDAALDHGRRLATQLKDSRTAPGGTGAVEVLAEMAAALDSIRGGGGAGPLHVSRLRGGAELGARSPDPSQPSLIFATVPMFGSRWLFRGFGSSASMRPVDAALAGIDSLVLLDESHLARPLLGLVHPVSDCDVGDPSAVVPRERARPVIVGLTATGSDGQAFTLDSDDLSHPIVRRRLEARKPISLVGAPARRLVPTLVAEVTALLRPRSPSTAVVFANSPRIARDVFDRLSRAGTGPRALDADLELLTGRLRDREGDVIRARLLDPVSGTPSGRMGRRMRSRHLIVVSTQTLEVGADLDFDVLVTEACGARALTQRLGRLNRLGDADEAAGAIVFAHDATDFGVYGQEPRQVWDNLLAAAESGRVDLGPGSAAGVIGPPGDDPPRVGQLLPAHLWEWAKTTTPPEGEAHPEHFFAGFDDDGARVSIVWRLCLPEDGEELLPRVKADESIDVPIWEAREALAALGDGRVNRLRSDRVTVEGKVPADRLRPGDLVIVDASQGGYDAHGWAPECRDPVVDPSLLRPPGLPLDTKCVRALVAEGDDVEAAIELVRTLAESPSPDEELDRAALADELRRLLLAAGPSPRWLPREWEDFVSGLRSETNHPVDGLPRLVVRAAIRHDQAVELRSDVFDELSFTAVSAALAEHLGTVGELARRIAVHIGLPAPLAEAVSAAGAFHDVGKHDVRFQRWLDPTLAAEAPLAKSSRPWHLWRRDQRASGWPQGGRHEELSRRLVAAWLEENEVEWDDDLVQHLVVAHHGYGRPLVPPVDDPAPTTLAADMRDDHLAVSGDLGLVDWNQPARFRRCCERYGYWGLALLEAIVRQADHQASAVVVA